MLKTIVNLLNKINEPIGNIASKVSGLLLVVMTLIVLLQVSFRYILNMPLHWTDETSRFLMIYMTYLCLPLIYLTDKNIAMTFLLEKIQKTRIIHLLMVVIHVLCIALFAVWIYFGWLFYQTGSVMADSLAIPMYFIYGVPPVMMVVTCLSALQKLINEMHLFISYKPEPEEPTTADTDINEFAE